jgi:hypothetical protein
MTDDNITPTDTVRWIADATSAATVAKLRAAAGGTIVYIPETVRPSYRLVKIVGREDALKIRDALGSGPIYIPVNETRGPKARAAKIMQMTKQGRPVREIAMVVGVCMRTVLKVRAAQRARRDRRGIE